MKRALVLLLVCGAARAADPWGGAWGASWGASWGGATSVPLIEVPDCSGLDEEACVEAIEALDLVAAVVTRCHNTVAAGDVIAIRPPAGSKVSAGSEVVVRVSDGNACVPGGGSDRSVSIGIGIGIY